MKRYIRLILIVWILGWEDLLLAQGSICVLLNPDKACPLSDADKEKMAIENQVNNARSGLGQAYRRPISGETVGFAPSGSASSDYTVVNLPLHFGIGGPFGVQLDVPFIETEESKGIGHSLAAISHTFIGSKKFATFALAGLIVPTGSHDVTPIQKHPHPFLSLSALLEVKDTRALFVGTNRFRITEGDYDPGDVSTLFIGYDKPFFGAVRYYASFFQTYIGTDTYNDEVYNNATQTVDLSLGLVFLSLVDFRLGFTLPVYTYSNVISASDRYASIDVGMRFGL